MTDLAKTVSTLPNSPGVYIYKNSSGEIIYVGKAINLKKRVSQYFQRDDALGAKTTALVSQIHTIEHHVVDSELQALLLEANLIKKYHPKYNSQLRDDKSYIYICITKEQSPRIYATHKSQLNKTDDFYGPFPNSGSVRTLLKTVRRIYPFRSCRILPKKPCLYYDLKLCTAPCVNDTGYRKLVGKIRKFLNGNINSLITDTQKQIRLAAKSENYETALELKKQLDALTYVTSGWSSARDLFKTHELVDDQIQKSTNQLLLTLQPNFPHLNQLSRIECFDISNLGNNYFVGSMTVFDGKSVNSSEYKQFKIKTKLSQDDMFMMREVLYRRFNHPEWGIPDLIVLDGGKPQLSVVHSALPRHPNHQLFSHTAIIGLAKKFETLVIKTDNSWQEINLPQNSQGLLLLTRLRDEAHRFANRYRKKLIQKANFPPNI